MKWGDAINIQYEDNSFDVAAMAFESEISQIKFALKEMKRVVLIDGQILILELTTPDPGFFKNLYSFYLNGFYLKLLNCFLLIQLRMNI